MHCSLTAVGAHASPLMLLSGCGAHVCCEHEDLHVHVGPETAVSLHVGPISSSSAEGRVASSLLLRFLAFANAENGLRPMSQQIKWMQGYVHQFHSLTCCRCCYQLQRAVVSWRAAIAWRSVGSATAPGCGGAAGRWRSRAVAGRANCSRCASSHKIP